MRINPFTRFVVLMPLGLLLGLTLFASVSYQETRKAMIREFHAALREETNALETIYQQQGYDALIEVVSARSNANPSAGHNETAAVYLLTDAQGKKTVGNLNAWPATVKAQDESSLQFVDPATGDTIVAVLFLLYEDRRLLVGRRALFEHVGYHLWRNYALLVIAVLLASLFSGWAFTRGLRRRLGRISATAERIRLGHLSERIPQSQSGDEIERLVGQLNRMLDQVDGLMQHARSTSSAIAHDLRHPISRLHNELEALADEITDARVRARLDALQTDVVQILDTFQAILRLGRLDSGAYTLQRASVDLNELVADAISLYDPVANSEGRQIHQQGRISMVEIDKDLVFQAVANVLQNAIRHGQGDIFVQVASASVSIRDHGAGIPLDSMSRVLQPFVRLDEARTEPGHGLGLSLVRAIVEAHHGTISLDDAKPGLIVKLSFPETA